MKDCLEKDEQSRLKIAVSDTGNYEWKFQSMSYALVREICLTIAQYLRHQALFGTDDRVTRYMIWPPMTIEWIPDTGDDYFICIAHEPVTHALQVSVNGFDSLNARIVLEDIAHIVNTIRSPQETTLE